MRIRHVLRRRTISEPPGLPRRCAAPSHPENMFLSRDTIAHLRGKPGGSPDMMKSLNMPTQALISLIVPTRRRSDQLRRLLASLADTVARPESLEVVLVLDADDPDSVHVKEKRLPIQHVIVPPGQ